MRLWGVGSVIDASDAVENRWECAAAGRAGLSLSRKSNILLIKFIRLITVRFKIFRSIIIICFLKHVLLFWISNEFLLRYLSLY